MVKSIYPAFMADRQAVQLFAVELPPGYVLVHQRDEPGVMGRLQDVGKFVLQAFTRLLGQIGIEPDTVRAGIATASAGLHPLDIKPFQLYSNQRLPLRDQLQSRLLQLTAIPVPC